jgi:hypothetical protein
MTQEEKETLRQTVELAVLKALDAHVERYHRGLQNGIVSPKTLVAVVLALAVVFAGLFVNVLQMKGQAMEIKTQNALIEEILQELF